MSFVFAFMVFLGISLFLTRSFPHVLKVLLMFEFSILFASFIVSFLNQCGLLSLASVASFIILGVLESVMGLVLLVFSVQSSGSDFLRIF